MCCQSNASLGAPCDTDDSDQCANGIWECNPQALVQNVVANFTGTEMTAANCSEYIQATSLYVTTTQTGLGSIVRSSIDGGLVETLVAGIDPDSLVVDKKHNRIFWTHHDDTIMSSALDGSDVQQPLDPFAAPYGLAIDVSGEKIYWTSKAGNPRVLRANLDGTAVETVVSGACTNSRCRSIAFDPATQTVYWVEGMEGGRIMRASAAGGNAEQTPSRGR